jgi:hypothetical protein
MRKLIPLLFVLLGGSGFTGTLYPGEPELKSGDIIFIVNPSGQGRSIQLATGSKYTHVGIIFMEGGKPMVYHAIEPVSKHSLEEFIGMSADGRYEIRRLRDQSLLSPEVTGAMLKEAKSQLGKHYDMAFSWGDEELYCSEFVWKLFKRALNIEIGAPRPLKDFDLSHPVVRATLEERYGRKIPLEEKMISPGDMFTSTLLR